MGQLLIWLLDTLQDQEIRLSLRRQELCTIVDVISRKAAEQTISDTDTRNLVSFWKEIYDIEIKPDEMPLLKVKMMNSESTFTYPPSMVFYGTETFVINAGLQKLIEDKQVNSKIKDG